MNDIYNDDDRGDDKLLAMAGQLSKEASPARDLWPEISATITTQQRSQQGSQRSRWTPMLAQAAAVVLLVGGSSGLTYLVVKDQPAEVSTVSPVAGLGVTARRASFDGNYSAFGGNYFLGAGYQDARGNLASKLDQELDRLSPESRTEVEKNITVIRDAIQQINEALEKEPDNVHLQELLLNTYREELNLMQRVGGLANNVMKRNDI